MVDGEEKNAIEKIGEEFICQSKSGQNPKIDDFVSRLPGLENEVRDFLEALAIVDRCKEKIDEINR